MIKVLVWVLSHGLGSDRGSQQRKYVAMREMKMGRDDLWLPLRPPGLEGCTVQLGTFGLDRLGSRISEL